MWTDVEDAEECWCPFARISFPDEGANSINRVSDGKPLDGCMCITVKCMAWQPHEEEDCVGRCLLMVKP